MKNFLDLVKKRQSVRGYKSTSVSREKIENCLRAAQLAPSASNSQPWKFIVIDDIKLKEEIGKYISSPVLKINGFIHQAPVIVLVISESQNFTAKIGQIIKKKKFNEIDVGIAAEHFCLQAVEEGLGTCIIGWFQENKVKKVLNIPRNKRVLLAIALGHPKDEKIREKSRKELDLIRTYNHF